MMGPNKPGLLNTKRPKVSDYKVDDEDSDARSHPNIKRPKR